MKTVEHWEFKVRLADAQVCRIASMRKYLAGRYRFHLKRHRHYRRYPVKLADLGALIRRKHRAYEIRMAKLLRKEASVHKRIAYFQERIGAIKAQNRFDRAMRRPPL